MFRRYEGLATQPPGVGLATYRCYNTDQIVGQALATFARIEASVPRREGADIKSGDRHAPVTWLTWP